MKSCNKNAHSEFVPDIADNSTHSSKSIEQHFFDGPSGNLQTLSGRKPSVKRACLTPSGHCSL